MCVCVCVCEMHYLSGGRGRRSRRIRGRTCFVKVWLLVFVVKGVRGGWVIEMVAGQQVRS